MAGKQWHTDHVKEQSARAKQMAQNLEVAANHPTGATIDGVNQTEKFAIEAIQRAADSTRVIVSEEGAR